MQHCSFRYTVSGNIGDEMQSLAAEQFLPRLDQRLDRDSLSHAFGPHQHLVIMNGWFTKFSNHWPPAPNVLPVYFGFHITPQPTVIERMLQPDSIAHFQQFAPIGCRDQATMDLLRSVGVDAFVSQCLTLTFPNRAVVPSEGKVFLVDLPQQLRRIVPSDLSRDAVVVSHEVQDIYGESIKFGIARHLMSLYRDQARLVITTRLHCTLPCLAMGIPVIFFANKAEQRVSVAAAVGLQIYPLDASEDQVDWEPISLDISEEKAAIVAGIRQKMCMAESCFAYGGR
jgi:hypothetical protein